MQNPNAYLSNNIPKKEAETICSNLTFLYNLKF